MNFVMRYAKSELYHYLDAFTNNNIETDNLEFREGDKICIDYVFTMNMLFDFQDENDKLIRSYNNMLTGSSDKDKDIILSIRYLHAMKGLVNKLMKHIRDNRTLYEKGTTVSAYLMDLIDRGCKLAEYDDDDDYLSYKEVEDLLCELEK